MPSTSETQENDIPEVLHTGPSRISPSLSSFVVKLETYFRMAGIKYKSVATSKVSKKGKIPFVEYKGKEITDTAFIIEYFNEERNINLSEHLSPAEKAISLAFQRLCEENLYWVMVNYRWIVNPDNIAKNQPLSPFLKKILPMYAALRLRPKVKAMLHGHGMGRHCLEEINHIAEKDLIALSDFLGDKEFFMGSQPSEVDAAVFGVVSLLVETCEGSHQHKLIHEKLTNLVAYSQRMKQKYWPDWDECCYQEKKPEPVAAKEKEGEKKKEEKVEENEGEKKEETEQEEQQTKTEEPAKEGEAPATSETPDNDAQEPDIAPKEPDASGDAQEQKTGETQQEAS